MDQTSPTPSPIKHELFTREYNLGDLLMLAWKLFSENFQTILIVTLIIYVPIELVSAFTPTDGIFSVNIAATGILVLLAGVLVPLAMALIVRKQLDGQIIDYKTALKEAAGKWLPGLGTSVLMGLCVLGLSILLIIPGIIYGVFWTFAVYTVMLYNKSGWAAMKHSRETVRGRWWRVFGYLIVFGLISGLIGWIINMPMASFASNRGVYFISALLSDIVFSFVIVASVLFFLNLDATKKTADQKDKPTTATSS